MKRLYEIEKSEFIEFNEFNKFAFNKSNIIGLYYWIINILYHLSNKDMKTLLFEYFNKWNISFAIFYYFKVDRYIIKFNIPLSIYKSL